MAANDLRNVMPRDRRIARILALRREGNTKPPMLRRRSRALNLQSILIPLFENRNHQLFRGPWVRRALQHDQLAFLQPRRSSLRRIRYVTQVWLAMLRQRSRDAHNDGVLIR